MGRVLHVSQDGRGDFTCLADAILSIPYNDEEATTIYLHAGVYQEKLVIDKPYISIIGDGADRTILTYGDYARMKLPDGTDRGTFRTQTLLVHTHDFTAKDLTIENSAGSSGLVGQAIALYVDVDRNSFYHCRILGNQDTLFTGPLPPAPLQKGGFTGPLEHAPRLHGRQYYYQCYICGDVDFIFGSATAYFEECEIYSVGNEGELNTKNVETEQIHGYITAASTPEDQPIGYVFLRCRLRSNCPANSVYLGRPWRNYAKTVFIECELGEHIRREGWHDWDKKDAHTTIEYAEYRNDGPGANPHSRASFSKQLSEKEAEHYWKEKILWFPEGSNHFSL